MKRVGWTESEIQTLIKITNEYRNRNRQINWEAVSKRIHNRTASQCKSYYANVLKKTLDVEIRQNHMWNRVEILALWTFGVLYNRDYELIQKKFMPKFTVKQIASQFSQIARKQQEIHQHFMKALLDPKYLRTLSENEFKMEWYIVQVGWKRMKMIEVRIFQRSNEEVPDTQYPVDIAELPAIKAFFQDIHPNQLVEVYKPEEVRRGYDIEPFYYPEYQNNFGI
ncbi:Conserved_hypothetical protein [Hexamita inflata]|uniref:Uncharacterized protein n=1 Tax=Hexamita inflata TaxID=28002 RepID=A0AA86P2D9_9EUKA|nr:Conserved hypothetical protein [Hexamita inflata]